MGGMTEDRSIEEIQAERKAAIRAWADEQVAWDRAAHAEPTSILEVITVPEPEPEPEPTPAPKSSAADEPATDEPATAEPEQDDTDDGDRPATKKRRTAN